MYQPFPNQGQQQRPTTAKMTRGSVEYSASSFGSPIASSSSSHHHEDIERDLFGLNYNAQVFKPTKRRIIHFPKDVLTTNVPQIREFNEPQKHLYYYLTWSCKMALVDGGFIHYSFRDSKLTDIGVFNTELHDKRTNAVLFMVAIKTDVFRAKYPATPLNSPNSKSNDPLWTMETLMTARQLFNDYGIKECDLPNGSRSERKYFQSQINTHYQRLSNLVHVNDWKKIPLLPNKKALNLADIHNIDLNEAIAASIEQIQNNELELIPVLTIKGKVYCDALIPIKVANNKWFAVSYKTSTIRPFKATVTGLCVDGDDIINKASLVDANAVTAYNWMAKPQPQTEEFKDEEDLPTPTLKLADSCESLKSDVSHSAAMGLQQQLAAALQREKLLMDMMMNQTALNNQINQLSSARSTPSLSSVPVMQTPSLSTTGQSLSAPLPKIQVNGTAFMHNVPPMPTPSPFELSFPGMRSLSPSPSLSSLGSCGGFDSGFPDMRNMTL